MSEKLKSENFDTLELKANLNPEQREYLEVLKDKMKKILGYKTKQDLARTGDIKSLRKYRAVLSEIRMFLRDKEKLSDEAFEASCLDFFEKIEDKVNRLWAVENLAGMNSERAWTRRMKAFNELIDPNCNIKNAYADVLSTSLAGLDSQWAWNLREKILDLYTDKESNLISDDKRVRAGICEGLVGLDSETSWQFRQKLLDRGFEAKYVVQSLAGLDSELAWDMRSKLINAENDPDAMLLSLRGLDSDRAWHMRKKLSPDEFVYSVMAQSIAGLDCDKAWQIRDKISSSEDLCQSLVALDSDRAWKKRRDILKTDKVVLNRWVAFSLGGLDTKQAWEMRQQILDLKLTESFVARGLYGGIIRVALRKAHLDKEGINLFQPENDLALADTKNS